MCCVTVVQGHPRSPKLVPIESPYGFLLVFHAYLLPFPIYNDLLVENLRFSPLLPTPVSFEALAAGSCRTGGMKVGIEKLVCTRR